MLPREALGNLRVAPGGAPEGCSRGGSGVLLRPFYFEISDGHRNQVDNG